MLEHVKAYSSFSVSNIEEAKKFYGDTLGLPVKMETREGCGNMLYLQLEGNEVLVYEKKDHSPASFTVLNFPVKKIESTVKELKGKGISFEHYDSTSEDGINRGEGPTIAWFKDPFGNFLSVLEENSANAQTDLELKRFILEARERIFTYFTRPELIERWCFPDGMTLKVPVYEAKIGGNFRFEHTNDEGVWVCTGYLKEFIPGEKLVQVETVRSPDGTVLIENAPSTIWFDKVGAGTEIRVEQSGFSDSSFRDQCEEGWTQSFDNLSNLLTGGLGSRSDQSLGAGKTLQHR